MSREDLALVFEGTFIHALSVNVDDKNRIQYVTNGLLGISKEGIILFVANVADKETLEKKYGTFGDKLVHLGKQFLIPGFVDTHIHAPQYAIAGTGTDLPLLEWLNKYTFPTEKKYKEITFAKEIYTKVVHRTLSNGTTCACYYSSIHLEATKLLAEVINQQGQRAFVGKVCMDRNSPEDYVETTPESLQTTEQFITHCQAMKDSLVTPIMTPRFAPSCTVELMVGLSDLAKKYNVPIQSHISENKGEVEWVKSLHPECTSYTDVYRKYGLLNERTVMAHAIYLSDDELSTFRDCQAGVSEIHTACYTIGILDVSRALKAGVKVGLGTDISGGYSPSILAQIRAAVFGSNSLTFQNISSGGPPLTYKDFFALATLGGSQVLGLQDKIGNFLVGKHFDALVVDPFVKDSPFDVTQHDSLPDIFEKFIFLGDDRNLVAIYVNGKKVLSR